MDNSNYIPPIAEILTASVEDVNEQNNSEQTNEQRTTRQTLG